MDIKLYGKERLELARNGVDGLAGPHSHPNPMHFRKYAFSSYALLQFLLYIIARNTCCDLQKMRLIHWSHSELPWVYKFPQDCSGSVPLNGLFTGLASPAKFQQITGPST